MTLDDFLTLPEEKPALDFLDGIITRKGEPTGQHSRLQGALTMYLNRFADPFALGVALLQLRTTFAGASLVADIAFYRHDRIPITANGEIADDFFEPADFAIEIASPEESRVDLVQKCEWYVAHGAPMALLIDPDHRSVLDFRPGAPARSLRGTDPIDFAPVLPGIQLTVQELFSWLRRPPPDPAP